MAYKKYIKRGGKTYGPYVYHSKRVDGKVVSEYIGPQKREINYKKISLVLLGIFVFLTLVFFLRNFKGEVTGRAVLDFDVNYSYLEKGIVEGSLNLSLEEEDFIPATSKIIFENGGNISEFYLKDLIHDSEIIEKEIPHLVYFDLIVEFGKKVSEINETNETTEEDTEETETNITINETITEIINETMGDNESGQATGGGEETANETIEENESNDETNETTEETEESENSEDVVTSESEVEETETDEVIEKESKEDEVNEAGEESGEAPLTGETISETENQMLILKIAKIISGFFLSLRTTGYATENSVVIPGEVSFNQDFVHNFEKGEGLESVVIEPGSVRTDSKNLSEEDIELKIEDCKVIVSTNYSEIAEGFSGTDLIINISDLNMTFVLGELKIKIVEPGSGKEVFSFLAIVEEGGIGENITEINETKMIFLPEVIELSDSERDILFREFGENITMNVSEAKEKNNLLVLKYELADYKMIRSYDLDLNREIIESFMERDRIKFLKDIAMTLSHEEEPGEKRDEFLGEWSV